MIRVILIDDHPIMRMGVSRFLNGSGFIEVVGEANDGIAGLALAESIAWDVLVLDISMANLGGFEVIKRLLAHKPAARIVVLSHHPSVPFAARSIQEGAAAFVSKSSPPGQLVEAIREVAAGRRWTPPPSIAEASAAETSAERMGHELLTKREYQVFQRTAEGRSTLEIAAELNVSPSTVSNHIAKIKEKLGLRTRGEITTYAVRARILE